MPLRITLLSLFTLAFSALGQIKLPSTVQIDLVWPQNNTYLPDRSFPVVFNIQNAWALAGSKTLFDWAITADGSRIPQAGNYGLMGAPWTTNPPSNSTEYPDYLSVSTANLAELVNSSVTHWTLYWSIGFREFSSNECAEYRNMSLRDPDDPTDNAYLIRGNMSFSTSASAKVANISNLPECLPLVGQINLLSRAPVTNNPMIKSCPVVGNQTAPPNSCGLAVRGKAFQRVNQTLHDQGICNPNLIPPNLYCTPPQTPRKPNDASERRIGGNVASLVAAALMVKLLL